MHTREDYLISYEDKLLGILKDLYTAANKNLGLTYGLSVLWVLIDWHATTEVSLFGAKVSVKGQDMMIYIPILTSIIYILINFQLIRLSRVFRHINENSKELLSENEKAKPITIVDIHLYGAGIIGLILSLTRWQINALIQDNPFKGMFSNLLGDSLWRTVWRGIRLLRRILEWILRLFARIVGLMCLFFLPLIIMGYSFYTEFLLGKSIPMGIPLLSFSLMILIAISTTICGLIMSATYLVDLLDTLKKDFSDSFERAGKFTEILKVISKTVNYFVRY